MTQQILIIDDSPTSRLLFRAHFPESEDYILYDAENSEEALVTIQQNPPNIIFLDYNFPEGNGLEIARDIIATGIKSRFVLLTANLQKTIINAAAELGINDVLEKPITKEKIINILEEISVA